MNRTHHPKPSSASRAGRNSQSEPGEIFAALALLLLPTFTGIGAVALLLLWAAQGITG